MKKIVLFAAAFFTLTAASAQTGEITSAKGENWLSQDGDWGLTFDAQPLLNYAGGLFNGNSSSQGNAALNNLFSSNTYGMMGVNTDGTLFPLNQVVIGGKKLVDANTAYRGKLRIGFGSTKNTELTTDLGATQPPYPAATLTVEDVTKRSYMGVNLGFGLEKRVGSTRVVGVYGAEVNFGIGSAKTTYEYGNAQSVPNPDDDRITEEKSGSIFGIGLNAFAGVEWFAAPKISLSGEYTWGLAMRSQGFGSTTRDRFVVSATDPNTGSVTSVDIENTAGDNKTSSFNIDTGVSGASIGVNFYFQ